jgi:FSR family fosmidomycin resistance protein-like MFS transporter
MFHVGGGSISLNLIPRHATAPGIFVAPGAFGILIGTIIGNSGYFIGWPFVVVLSSLCILMLIVKAPKIDYAHNNQTGRPSTFKYFEPAILLLLFSIAVRSLIGSAVVFPWKSDVTLSVTLTAAVVVGKALGGFSADKLGWINVATVSLLVSAPLLSFGANIPYIAIAGMFLFNSTMATTLVATSNMLPGRPGFSFGLTCLALISGALPTFTESKNAFNNQLSILTITLESAVAIYCGLRLFLNSPFKDSKTHMKRSKGGKHEEK